MQRRRSCPNETDTSQASPAGSTPTSPTRKRALPFYRGLFGWEFEDVMPEGSAGSYIIGRIRGGDVAAVASIPEGAPPLAMWNTYVWVDSADETAARAQAAGGAVISEPFDVLDAGRMAVVADPEGAVFCVWQAKNHQGAKVVNEHGSLNFNGLATRDPEAAKAFYGAVFGWQTLALPAGVMWTLPGYGDHLEENDSWPPRADGADGRARRVHRRRRRARSDPPDDSETPAHWSVTFAVDDADATATKARELGGEVVAGPVDAPWTRIAVIKDPHGATFVASQFVPENRDLEA